MEHATSDLNLFIYERGRDLPSLVHSQSALKSQDSVKPPTPVAEIRTLQPPSAASQAVRQQEPEWGRRHSDVEGRPPKWQQVLLQV